MNQSKAKSIRREMLAVAREDGLAVNILAKQKFDQLNRYGQRQHRVISPKRTLKKMVIAEMKSSQ